MLAVVGILIPAAWAADLSINAFVGRFVGSGLARDDVSEYFDLTVRDLDVAITREGAGFNVAWTTVLREGGDPDNPKIKRKSSAVSFVPSDRPGIFRGAQSADPMSGSAYAWARIKGQTLTVHSLVIDEIGSYTMHTYDRTLTGLGMELRFTRVRDGEPTKTVTGRLTKASQ
jgi:hypothetical protein